MSRSQSDVSAHGGKEQELLANIRARLPELAQLLERMGDHWSYEDLVYRFYYQSFKVYAIQGETRCMMEALKSVAPAGTNFSPMFEEICRDGASGKAFEPAHNRDWTTHTRPLLEAFFHARFFLEMAVKYGKALEEPPTVLPSGWAALLCLYGLR